MILTRKYLILTCQYPIDTLMYCVSICKYLGKYLHVFLNRYVEIDQIVFDKNTYAILTNRFTDDPRPPQALPAAAPSAASQGPAVHVPPPTTITTVC